MVTIPKPLERKGQSHSSQHLCGCKIKRVMYKQAKKKKKPAPIDAKI